MCDVTGNNSLDFGVDTDHDAGQKYLKEPLLLWDKDCPCTWITR